MSNRNKNNGGGLGGDLLKIGLGLFIGAAVAVTASLFKDKMEADDKKEEEEKIESHQIG